MEGAPWVSPRQRYAGDAPAAPGAPGKVRANLSFKRHNLRKRPKKMKRKARGTMILSAADARIVKSYLPHA